VRWSVAGQSGHGLEAWINVPVSAFRATIARGAVEKAGGHPCRSLSLDGGSEGGGLTITQLIGVPAPAAARIEVVDVSSESLVVEDLCAPTAAELARAASDEPIVTLADAGWVIDQPVAAVGASVVRRTGSNVVSVATRIRFRVVYRVAAGDERPGSESGGPSALDPSVRLALERTLLGGPVAAAPSALRARALELGSGAEAGAADAAGDPDALRVIVDGDGLLTLTGAELQAAGWDLSSVDPSSLGLTSAAGTHAIAVRGDTEPGLGENDSIDFVGRAMTGPYTAANVYWLTKSGGGSLMGRKSGAPAGAPPAPPYTTTARFEEDSWLYYDMPKAEGDDRWMWSEALSAPESRTVVLDVVNLSDPHAAATLRVALQGYSRTSADPDHHAVISLNGAAIMDAHFDGLGVHTVEAPIPDGVLVDGPNQLQIEAPGDTESPLDRFFLNWAEIDYSAGYTAHNGRLDFACRVPGRASFRLAGFPSAAVRVFDVTDPVAPVELDGVSVAREGEAFSASFDADCREGTRWEAVAPEAWQFAERVERNDPSDLRNPANGADYVIVIHEDLEPGIQDLVDWHRGAGRRVMVARIGDIFDEFSHGVFDPRAIRDFLRYAAASWTAPRPTFVLLVGEANLDYKRNFDRGPENFVPSMEIDLMFGGQATSDAWFATLDDADPLPDVILGRITATRPEQVQAVVDKVIGFQTVGVADDWRRRAIMIADDDQADDFEFTSERLIQLLPPDTTAARFYAGSYPRDQDLTADIARAIEDGALVLNFTGHGGVDLWSPWPGGGRIFRNDDIEALSNADRLPIVTVSTCVNGWFAATQPALSMSESWVRHEGGGAVAAWSPTGLASSVAQDALLMPFYTGLFDGRGQSLGGLTLESAVAAYAQSGRWRDVISMFVFLGDPATVAEGASVRPTPTPTPTATPGPAYLPGLPHGPKGGADR
jgi:hypothetical protein